MDKLVEFNPVDYLKSLENIFYVTYKIDKTKFKIQNVLIKRGSIDYDLCISIKKFFEELLSSFVDKNIITDYKVSFIAIGIFRICFKNETWQEEPTFITVNVISNEI